MKIGETFVIGLVDAIQPLVGRLISIKDGDETIVARIMSVDENGVVARVVSPTTKE